MLSFLRDDNSNDVTDDASQLSSGGAEVAGEGEQAEDMDYLKPAAHGKNTKRTTVILMILFAVGALCVWVMIKKAAPNLATAATSQQEVQIDNALTQLTGIKTEMNSRIDQMLDKFYQYADVDQVKTHELNRNPFRHELYLANLEGLFDDSLSSLNLVAESDLQLWSIMQTENGNCCMINDKIVYEGDTISGFKVVRISSKFAELVSGSGAKVILKMPE
ncbi:MAG: hypothetical protein ACYTFK_09125 [Planctomycetota bacterium]